jgi:hypothetical protein
MSQKCNKCNLDKDIEEYYLRDGVYPFRICKDCVKAKRPKKVKPSAFELLKPEQIAMLTVALADRRNKMTNLAVECGVKYHELRKWVSEGRFTASAEKE